MMTALPPSPSGSSAVKRLRGDSVSGAQAAAMASASLAAAVAAQLISNPTPQTSSAPHTAMAGTHGDRLVLVMVGLPARGKTYIARRVCQYLR